jgi:phosphoglycerol transferase MdoB-like AlkP superfamily enzyme
MSSDLPGGSPRRKRKAKSPASWWQRLRQAAGVLAEVWRGLGAFDRFRTVIQVLVVITLLGVLPWHDSHFDFRRFINGVLTILAVAIFTAISLFPGRARKYSGEIAFGAAIVAFLLTPESTTSNEFYSASAQVVPVLFLALAFEQRAFQVHSSMDPDDRHFATFPAVGLLIAGVESFRGLLDKPQDVSLKLVTAGLVLGSVALVVRAVTGRQTQ